MSTDNMPMMSDRREVFESNQKNYGDVFKAIADLDALGLDVKAAKSAFNKIRDFLMSARKVAGFRAEDLNLDDVLREARESDPATVTAIADRIANIHLAELRRSLGDHGDAACAAIDARRAELHARWDELRPVVGDFDAEAAIAHDRVAEWQEFRGLSKAWSELRTLENDLLRTGVVPRESSRPGGVHRSVRVGHDAWARWSGRNDLEISDPPAHELYAQAAQALAESSGPRTPVAVW
ncbi:hypothetical protein [Tsukamurella tyrosinosolvens]|uniref:hypothetical protein n=1 Tax=Tsukamurella tyrosinosolvens TaxID=57704 RepID=UPI002DD43C34|nr:hypothetical protein [Tsukamurella tyrosinosolvens]MEC4614617.1 hypothetical protein [Tsukamurella tyrosinosolvens]